jgi:hypothetical protein
MHLRAAIVRRWPRIVQRARASVRLRFIESPHDAPMRPVFRHLLIICVVVLTACSATQFAYNRLDFLARWELGKYFDLQPAQRERFDRDFRVFWDWHRQHELPRYAARLRQIAARIETPPDVAEFEAWSNDYATLWEPSLDRLMPMVCALGASLSDAQATSLLEQADDDLRDYADDEVDLPEAKLRKKAERSLSKTLRQWLGELTPAQQQTVHAWNDMRPQVAAQWLAFRRRWRDELAATLAQRGGSEFCPRLQRLITASDSLWTAQQQRDFAANRQSWLQLFATLAPTLTQAQREHLRERLLGMADDFDALAMQTAGNRGAN